MSVDQVLNQAISDASDPASDWYGLTAAGVLSRVSSMLYPHSSWTALTGGMTAPTNLRLNAVLQRLNPDTSIIEQRVVHNVRVRYIDHPSSIGRHVLYIYSHTDAAVEFDGWYVTHFAVDLSELPLPPPLPHNEV